MLVDTGPLVALVDTTQPAHASCASVLQSARGPLLTTWACFTEATYLCGRIGGERMQRRLWELFARRIVLLEAQSEADRAEMTRWMERYRSTPMDLGDASLVVLSEATGDRSVFTLDSDFRVYRLSDGSALTVVPE